MNSRVELALAILRATDELEKQADGITSKAYGGAKDILKALAHGSRAAGQQLTAAGHPIAGSAAKLLPAAAMVYAGHKVLQSGPVQGAINRYRMWQYNRAVRKAQQQGYY